MPKGKHRKSKYHRALNRVDESDDESQNDNASVNSGQGEEGEGEEEEVKVIDTGEELQLAIDGLSEKSSHTRISNFKLIVTTFATTYKPELVSDRCLTVCDYIERSLRKGRGEEQIMAAIVASLLLVQLGDKGEDICKSLRPALVTLMHDNSVHPQVRTQCCLSLALITFLSGGEMEDVLKTMRDLERVFSASYSQNNQGGNEQALMHAAALEGWGLLLTLLNPRDVYSFMTPNNSDFEPSLKHLVQLLASKSLDLRLAAGETLALVYEQGRDCEEDFAEEFSVSLIESLRTLATESHKYRAKKDLKQQRATFRDVLRYIDEGETHCEPVHVGYCETLVLDTWARRRQYEALCTALGSGMNMHLIDNTLLRDIFEMGPVPEEPVPERFKAIVSRIERRQRNAAAFKVRSISRGKNRDKKVAGLNC